MKNGLKKLFLISLLLPLTITAAPTTITLQFTEPTTNTDLSALDNLSFYQGYCSTTPGGPYTTVETLPAPLPLPPLLSTLSITLTNCMTTDYGDVYFVVTAVSLTGFASVNSNEVKKSFADNRVPDAPVNLRE